MAAAKPFSEREAKGELEFFLKAGRMKSTGRRGWTFRGVEIPETVAAHSYRTALLALYYGRKFGVDVGRIVSLALLHDLNEVENGDTVADKFTKLPEKQKVAKGLGELKGVLATLPKGAQKEYAAMWLEENNKSTPEGRLARELNKLELALQALDYEMAGHPGETLDDLWEHVGKNVRDPRIRRLFSMLRKMRPGKGR